MLFKLKKRLGSDTGETRPEITKESIAMTIDNPEYFRGNVYVANGLMYTDKEYAEFVKKTDKSYKRLMKKFSKYEKSK